MKDENSKYKQIQFGTIVAGVSGFNLPGSGFGQIRPEAFFLFQGGYPSGSRVSLSAFRRSADTPVMKIEKPIDKSRFKPLLFIESKLIRVAGFVSPGRNSVKTRQIFKSLRSVYEIVSMKTSKALNNNIIEFNI